MTSRNLLALAVVGTVPLAIMLVFGFLLICFCCCCYNSESARTTRHGTPGVRARFPIREFFFEADDTNNTATNNDDDDASNNQQNENSQQEPPPAFDAVVDSNITSSIMMNDELNLQYRSPPAYEEIFKNETSGIALFILIKTFCLC